MEKRIRGGSALKLHGESVLLMGVYSLVLLASCLQWGSGGAVSRAVSFGLAAAALIALGVLGRGRVRVEGPRLSWADAVPLLLFLWLYVSRMPIPDLAWDTENYHIYAQESLMRDPFGMDYFPVRSINLNMLILGELVAGAFRHLLGYRLGTVYTLLVMAVAYFQVKRLLRLLGVRWREGWVALAAAAAVLADGMVLLMGSYYVDTLSVPLILEALLFLLREEENPGRAALWLGYVAGMAVSLKLSNAYLAVILAAVWLVRRWKGLRFSRVLGAACMAVLPLALFLVRGWVYAANPVFPYANELFHSPYFFDEISVNEFADLNGRFGPETWQQALLWPVYILSHPKRMSDELFTTGRLLISQVAMVGALGVGLRQRDRRLWGFALLYAAFYGVYLGPLQGYLRYIVALDLMGAALTCALAAACLRGTGLRALRVCAAGVLSLALAGQTGWLLWQNQTSPAETAERQPLLADPADWAAGLQWVGRDRGEAIDPAVTGQVDAWIAPLMGASYEVLIDPNKPLYGVGSQVLSTPETEEQQMILFQQAREEGRRLWCAVSSWAADEQILTLNRYGFRVVNARPVHTNCTPVRIDPMLLECEWVGREGDDAYSPAATTWTIVDTDLSAWRAVTVAVSMSGNVSKWPEEEAHTFVVELLDAEGHLVERLDPLVLRYTDESVQLRLEDLEARGIRTLRIYPDGEPLPGALLIVQHSGELTDSGLAAWMDQKYR